MTESHWKLILELIAREGIDAFGVLEFMRANWALVSDEAALLTRLNVDRRAEYEARKAAADLESAAMQAEIDKLDR